MNALKAVALVALGFLGLVGVLVAVWLLQALVLLIGGQLFFLVWVLPVLYCIYRSVFPARGH
jgi:hypothetical protein